MTNKIINKKAPGDAATSDTGAVEKIQVQDSTNSRKAQEIEKLERFIALYKEMYELSHSDAGEMVIGVDMFEGYRIHLGHEWLFENVTDYVKDTAFDQEYDYYRAEMCGVRLICLVEKEGLRTSVTNVGTFSSVAGPKKFHTTKWTQEFTKRSAFARGAGAKISRKPAFARPVRRPG